MTEEKEFLLLSKRDKILRINLKNLTDQEDLPLENVENVISIEYEMEGECVFYGDTDQRKIFKQCLNGSAAEVLVHNTQTVEGENYLKFTLFFKNDRGLFHFSVHPIIFSSIFFKYYPTTTIFFYAHER